METATKKTNRCPECGGEMVWEKRPILVRYEGQSATVKVTGWWCTSCGEGILDGKQLLIRERAFKSLKAKVDGVLAPSQVAKMREALGLSQREAGRVLGGGVRAFQKYESGETAVSVSMSHLLRLLSKHPDLVGELPAAPRKYEVKPPIKKAKRIYKPRAAQPRASTRRTPWAATKRQRRKSHD